MRDAACVEEIVVLMHAERRLAEHIGLQRSPMHEGPVSAHRLASLVAGTGSLPYNLVAKLKSRTDEPRSLHQWVRGHVKVAESKIVVHVETHRHTVGKVGEFVPVR